MKATGIVKIHNTFKNKEYGTSKTTNKTHQKQ
jgi:hypothetical protein